MRYVVVRFVVAAVVLIAMMSTFILLLHQIGHFSAVVSVLGGFATTLPWAFAGGVWAAMGRE